MDTAVMLTQRRIPAPPAIAARLPAGGGSLGALRGVLGVLGVVIALLVLADLAFGIIGPQHWIVLGFGAAIILAPVVFIAWRESRRSESHEPEPSDEVLQHDLDRDARHWFVEHEHGVMMVCPAAQGRTLFLDLSSVAEDARHQAWSGEGRIHLAHWRWWTTLDGATVLGFEASGATLPARILAERGESDPGAALFEHLGSPGDGDVIERPFAEVDAFLRQGMPAAEKPPR